MLVMVQIYLFFKSKENCFLYFSFFIELEEKFLPSFAQNERMNSGEVYFSLMQSFNFFTKTPEGREGLG